MSDSLTASQGVVGVPAGATLTDASSTRLRASGALRVAGDLTGCDVMVAGSLAVDGAIRGGTLAACGSVECGGLGGGDEGTEIWIGAPPEGDRPILRHGEEALGAAASARQEREDLLQKGRDEPEGLDHELREAITLAEFELPDLIKAERSLEWRVHKLRAFYDQGKLSVFGTIHRGVVVRVGLRPERYRCVEPLRGPLALEAFCGQPLILRLEGVDTPVDRHAAFERVPPRPHESAAA